MKQRKVVYWIAYLTFLFIFLPAAIYAGENDVVKAVTLCGDSALITMQHAGMVAVRKADVGEDMFQQIVSTSLELLESEGKTGFFDPGYPIDVCGHDNVLTITTIEKNK